MSALKKYFRNILDKIDENLVESIKVEKDQIVITVKKEKKR